MWFKWWPESIPELGPLWEAGGSRRTPLQGWGTQSEVPGDCQSWLGGGPWTSTEAEDIRFSDSWALQTLMDSTEELRRG